MHTLIEAGDPRLTMLSTLDEVDEALPMFEASVHESMWNMQRHASLHEIRDHHSLNERSRAQGCRDALPAPRRTWPSGGVRSASSFPYVRLAPSATPC